MFKHYISSMQFSNYEMLEDFFLNVDKHQHDDHVKDKIMATWFEEKSTRTRLSFESAMLRLGGKVINVSEKDSSVGKGESWEDTVKVLHQMCDIIVCRTSDESKAKIAASISKVPVINGGSGSGEHPTQGLLDMYTIWKHFKSFDSLGVGLVGDLKYSRTIHSLLHLLNLYGTKITYHVLAPEGLKINPQEFLKNSSIHCRFHKSMDDLINSEVNVIYMTRNQIERRDERHGLESFTYNPKLHHLTLKHVEKMPKSSIIMHPLPRGAELSVEIDGNERCHYWKQVENGLFVRMALIAMMLR